MYKSGRYRYRSRRRNFSGAPADSGAARKIRVPAAHTPANRQTAGQLRDRPHGPARAKFPKKFSSPPHAAMQLRLSRAPEIKGFFREERGRRPAAALPPRVPCNGKTLYGNTGNHSCGTAPREKRCKGYALCRRSPSASPYPRKIFTFFLRFSLYFFCVLTSFLPFMLICRKISESFC